MSFGVPEVSCATTSSSSFLLQPSNIVPEAQPPRNHQQRNNQVNTEYGVHILCTNTAMMTACICIMYHVCMGRGVTQIG